MIRIFSLTLFLNILLSTNAISQKGADPEFTRADTLRGMLSPLRDCYDVNYYHLDIRLNIDEQSITGSNLFRFTATRDFKRLQFDLFDNFEISRIEYEGEELKYETEYDAVFIEFPATIKKGAKAEFTVFYSGIPLIAKNAPWDGGFIFKQDEGGAPWVAVACQGLGASSWWPCKDHLSDEPDSMMISVTVPRGLQNISNGRLRSKETLADGATRFNWFVSNPINTYNVTLNVGDFGHFQDEYQGLKGKLSLDYFVLRNNLEKAKEQFKDSKRMLACFEEWFGPYPFYQDGYKLVETPYLGMEHQSAIAYGNEYKKGYRGADLSGTGHGLSWDYIIVHESGHEWFGNNISAKDAADMWIHEAFTTYSESLFVECEQGKNAAIAYIKGERKNIRNDKPIIGPYHVNQEGSGDMYFKGSSILHTIRTLIDNDDRWKDILRGLNKTFGLKTCTTEEIISYINKRSGKDFSKLFRQYLYYKNIPALQLKTIGKNTIEYSWKADVKNFDMPVRIQLPGSKGFKMVYPTVKPQRLNISGNPKALIVDTDNFYIHVQR